MGVFDSNFDERESHLRVLADQLFFTVEKNGDRFTLKAHSRCFRAGLRK